MRQWKDLSKAHCLTTTITKKTLENIHFVDNIQEKEVEKNEYRGKGEFCDSSSTTNQKSLIVQIPKN